MEKNKIGTLCVGGKVFVTTRGTLEKRGDTNFLARMVKGRVRQITATTPIQAKAVFVDRDGKHFRHILNWLRDSVVPELDTRAYKELLREADYYRITGEGYPRDPQSTVRPLSKCTVKTRNLITAYSVRQLCSIHAAAFHV